ncbi:protein of unknown function [Microbulbifer donghaiensis]|uniref:Lipoprotein n=1 Tax=Microbulbifer donghaiensis TaxID=494016 RepID=A0A1M5H9H9_9GAMM|nr:DUF4919 domain-containing protein [Microbulbifer donghaiensis]SHG12649.1 protein of unknown function [Microbulbifer donghaiensis]
MKYLVLASLVLLTACASTTPADQAPSPDAAALAENANGDWYKQSLATLRQKGEQAETADFQRVREAYTSTRRYAPYMDPVYDIMKYGINQMHNGNGKACAQAATKIVAVNFTSLTGHYLGMVCNRMLGNRVVAEQYKFALNGFMDAIRATGSGKTIETAFETYSTQELRAFLQLQGLEIVGQSLVQGDDGVYDQMKVRDPETGKESSLFFNITKQWAKGMTAQK